MIHQLLFLSLSLASFECSSNFVIENEKTGEGEECLSPLTRSLEGREKGMEVVETEETLVASFVNLNCGHAFACDNEVAHCWSHCQCINPSGEALSGCCIPNTMSEMELFRGVVADYVIQNCGIAFACDSEYGCSFDSECVNPSGERLSGCCVPRGMGREDLEEVEGVSSSVDSLQFGSLNGIDLQSMVLLHHCDPSFACDHIGAPCAENSWCINPSEGALASCCVPKGITREELATGVLKVKREGEEENEESGNYQSSSSSNVGHCIPRVSMANETNHEEL
ncbi:hypothetical protein PMAYCL1PPCAC_29724 [Pristionchus mayeri]|uniref:Uncharacterized protein n=1 Tax=Pristionchus mayeri TaxID=1317129 RepID=A0AAN5DCW4_9BILA|nr:hypothetical protein PMAYCL1PPCAC_29724 [Pristionchus mayeri]